MLRRLEETLRHTHPQQKIDLTISRDGQSQTLSATLAWRPSEVVQPGGGMSEKAAKSLGLVVPRSTIRFPFC